MSVNYRIPSACLALVMTFVGCATRPPRTGDLPIPGSNTLEERQTAATGSITVSTLQFNPVTAGTKGPALDFGKLKDVETIQKSIQAANMGLTQLQYDAMNLSLAFSLAGSQIYASRGSSLGGGVNGTANLGALAGLFSGATPDATNPPISGSATLGAENKASYTETFESPDKPESPPETPAVPEGVMGAFVELLKRSSTKYTLDPQKELALIAAYRKYMDALEEFYSSDRLGEHGGAFAAAGFKCEYLPYRVLFSVAVQPGWFPTLEQYESVVHLKLDPDYGVTDQAIVQKMNELRTSGQVTNSESKGVEVEKKFTEQVHKAVVEQTKEAQGYRIVVLNVVPAETAQTLDEMTAGISQLAATLQASGAFSAAAFNGAIDGLIANAQRLEGFRKNTTVVATYPDNDEIQLRIRPTVVANNHFSDSQPSNYVFAATVLVRKPYYYSDEEAKTNKYMIYTDEANLLPGGAFKDPRSVQPAFIEAKYEAYFEKLLHLRQKGVIRNRGLYYYSPERYGKGRNPARIYVAREGIEENPGEVYAVLKQWPEEKPKPFDFVGDVFGFYDEAGKIVTAYAAYSISNPSKGAVVLSCPEPGVVVEASASTGASVVGVARISNIPAPHKKGAPVNILLQALSKDDKRVVLNLSIPPRSAQPGPNYPVISVERAGVSMSPTDLNKLDTEKLKAILGVRVK